MGENNAEEVQISAKTGDRKAYPYGIEASAETHESNWDYIYKSEHLARLEGKENSKKRNRVSRFTREYPDWRIEFTDTENNSEILNDMLRVEDEWLTEQEERAGSVLTEPVGRRYLR